MDAEIVHFGPEINNQNFERARNAVFHDQLRAQSSPAMGLVQEVPVMSSVLARAMLIQANLASELPSFIKPMLRSNVTRGFQLPLPKRFCELNLPQHDTIVLLVDESRKEYRTNFLVARRALSSGWKKFSEEHQLQLDDVLVFHLVSPCTFKVYIVRANGLGEADGALNLMSLGAFPLETYFGSRQQESLPLNVHRNDIRTRMTVSSSHPRPEEGSEHEINDFGANNMHCTSSRTEATSRPQGSIGRFSIVVNGLVIDSELPEELRRKYNELCYSQKSYLHDNLLENVTPKLAAEVISQIVNIANAITTSKLSTPRADFEAWYRNLNAFELLGMNVGFLRARLNQLQSVAFESGGAMKAKRYEEVKLERARLKMDMRTFESKLWESKEHLQRLDIEMKDLKVDSQRHELLYEEVAKAPW